MTTIMKKAFGAETNKVLRLMIDSIYTNKSIFLRELISNASDACDKVRTCAMSDHRLLEEALLIDITLDKDNGVLTIKDNGIGMNATDMESHLGVIANSGTQNFLDSLGDGKNGKKDDRGNFIGQFGVGFYSSFMVAEEVTVHSTKLGEEGKTYLWRSCGNGYYEIEESAEVLPRGTKVSLKMKQDALEYLDQHRVRHIITLYSDHINYPVHLKCEGCNNEQINQTQAIWTKNASDITKEEYRNFYQHITHSPDEPWLTMHNRVEGAMEYINLLYIPTKRPFDLFSPDRTTRVKLYIRRVFIADDGLALIPKYLRFLRGIIDTDDLPLNVSRETLQHSAKSVKLTNAIVKRVLGTLKNKSEADPTEYVKFWETFGEVLKEGLCEPVLEEKDQLMAICRFRSTKAGTDYISLDDYITNMKTGQNEIYYMISDSYQLAEASPQLEGFKNRGVEVILLQDPVDAFWTAAVDDYRNHNLVSAASTDVNLSNILDDENSKINATTSTNSAEGSELGYKLHNDLDTPLSNDKAMALTDYIKSVLGASISKVIISQKLIKSPACISMPDGGMNPQLEKLLLEQKQLNKRIVKVLEVNPNHTIIRTISEYLQNHPKDGSPTKETRHDSLQQNGCDEQHYEHAGDCSTEDDTTTESDNNRYWLKEDYVKKLIKLVFAQACITAGQWVENPNFVADMLDSMAIDHIIWQAERSRK